MSNFDSWVSDWENWELRLTHQGDKHGADLLWAWLQHNGDSFDTVLDIDRDLIQRIVARRRLMGQETPEDGAPSDAEVALANAYDRWLSQTQPGDTPRRHTDSPEYRRALQETKDIYQSEVER